MRTLLRDNQNVEESIYLPFLFIKVKFEWLLRVVTSWRHLETEHEADYQIND